MFNLLLAFIDHIRLLLLNHYPNNKNILLTIPIDVDYEIMVFQFALKLLSHQI